VTRAEALRWAREVDDDADLDDADLDDACVALGYDPGYLRGDAEDPIDRRWDTVCAEVRS